MRGKRLLLVVAAAAALVLLAALPAAAQSDGPRSAPQVKGPLAPVTPLPTLDTSSLRRIRRELAETPPTAPSGRLSLLKLNYYVEVVGKAPRLDLLANFNVGRGTPVQYGAMTHDEFLRQVAPFWRRLGW